MPVAVINENEVASTIQEVIENARKREETYLPRGISLSPMQKHNVRGFFPERVLDTVKVLQLEDERIPNPPFQERARKRGYRLMLDFAHMAEITHPRLVIFQEKMTPRLLFHSLVHVVQYEMLGRERYLELYVRAFVETGSYTTVPMEMQAFNMDERFTEDPTNIFSVEAEVRAWLEAGKYLTPRRDDHRARS
jgi:hypothetical protein